MKIDFTVGEIERHAMELTFDHETGALLIFMDGAQVLLDSPETSDEPVKSYELAVGESEKHVLALELTYGEAEIETGIPATPRLSLMLTPVST